MEPLCDLMMPEVTGMELYEWIKKRRPGVEQRMVFVTGGIFTQRAEDFLHEVPNPRLVKPFKPEKIKDLVRRVIYENSAPKVRKPSNA